MKEHKKRSILKALSWRAVGTIVTVLAVYILTGKMVLSMGIGVLEVFSKFLLYYLHERAWDRVQWGKSTLEIDPCETIE